MNRNIIVTIIYFFLQQGVIGGDTTDKETTTLKPTTTADDGNSTEEYNNKIPYCFRFTWLGPTYDNTTKINGTCKGMKEKYHMKNLPCIDPLVITYDGTPPDVEYLWQHYRQRVICKRTRGEVCIKYSYTFNGQLQNVTYMCGKAFVLEEGPVTDGCYTDSVRGYDVEACVCQSIAGMTPCNSANSHAMSLTVFIFTSFVYLFFKLR